MRVIRRYVQADEVLNAYAIIEFAGLRYLPGQGYGTYCSNNTTNRHAFVECKAVRDNALGAICGIQNGFVEHITRLLMCRFGKYSSTMSKDPIQASVVPFGEL